MSKLHFAARLLTAGSALVLCLGVSSVLAAGAGTNPAIVKADEGAVRGVIGDGVLEFKGIPYAQPPVGKLRWAMPQPVKPWHGVLDATKYKSECPQLERYGLTEASYDENCLYLNVTTPYDGKPVGGAKHAVIVWIHGGAFVGGSSSLYPLAHLARAGNVVVVSMNYRLGVFGFMADPAFGAAHNGGYGLEDQRAALRWVKRNIAAFGGNPDNVTIAGESAGAASVCMHILAPKETKGLFEKAIVQSAGCATPLPTVKQGEKVGEKVAALVGCDDRAKMLSCLRSKPVKELLEAGFKVQGSSIVTFLPVIGAETVPQEGQQAISEGKFVHVPVIMGGTRDELRLYIAYAIQAGQKVTKDNYVDLLRDTYGDKTDAVLREYPLGDYSSAPAALGTVWSDFRPDVGINNCIYLQTAQLLRQSVPVYEFVFADSNAPPVTENPGFEMGAVHSSELPYFFPHFDNTTKLAGPDLAPASQRLADQMVAYWTSFAKTDHPSAPDSPKWKPFEGGDTVMNFEPGKMGNINAGVEHKCAFWKSLYPKILSKIPAPRSD